MLSRLPSLSRLAEGVSSVARNTVVWAGGIITAASATTSADIGKLLNAQPSAMKGGAGAESQPKGASASDIPNTALSKEQGRGLEWHLRSDEECIEKLNDQKHAVRAAARAELGRRMNLNIFEWCSRQRWNHHDADIAQQAGELFDKNRGVFAEKYRMQLKEIPLKNYPVMPSINHLPPNFRQLPCASYLADVEDFPLNSRFRDKAKKAGTPKDFPYDDPEGRRATYEMLQELQLLSYMDNVGHPDAAKKNEDTQAALDQLLNVFMIPYEREARRNAFLPDLGEQKKNVTPPKEGNEEEQTSADDSAEEHMVSADVPDEPQPFPVAPTKADAEYIEKLGHEDFKNVREPAYLELMQDQNMTEERLLFLAQTFRATTDAEVRRRTFELVKLHFPKYKEKLRAPYRKGFKTWNAGITDIPVGFSQTYFAGPFRNKDDHAMLAECRKKAHGSEPAPGDMSDDLDRRALHCWFQMHVDHYIDFPDGEFGKKDYNPQKRFEALQRYVEDRAKQKPRPSVERIAAPEREVERIEPPQKHPMPPMHREKKGAMMVPDSVRATAALRRKGNAVSADLAYVRQQTGRVFAGVGRNQYGRAG